MRQRGCAFGSSPFRDRHNLSQGKRLRKVGTQSASHQKGQAQSYIGLAVLATGSFDRGTVLISAHCLGVSEGDIPSLPLAPSLVRPPLHTDRESVPIRVRYEGSDGVEGCGEGLGGVAGRAGRADDYAALYPDAVNSSQ